MSGKAHPDRSDGRHSHTHKASPKVREVAKDKIKLGDLEAPPNNPYPFNHLHVHTEFSLLDGLSKIDRLVDRAYKLGMRALAISDHGTMYGVMQFYRACVAKGIQPIIGCEAYLAKGNMRVHDVTEKQPYHLLLLARNYTGYKNLLKIATTSQLEGFYARPRIDRDYLAAHAEGIIATSGCLAAEIPRMVQDGREDEARRTIGWYQDVFGKDNFFLELQSHDIPELHTLNKWLYENAGYANVPFLATNDVHYVLETDADAHDTLMCIQTNSLKSDEKRMKMTDASYYLRSGAEMWQIFGSEIPSALTNTILVAEMVEPFNLDKQGYHLPIFPVPEGFDAAGYLRHLAMKGLEWRYGEQAHTEYVQQRIEYELGIINKMGFDTYFLIVWDLCQFARHADIWWNVRGSAAGSVVAYSLGITNIDPLHNNLIFERFLNPGRVTMPDIDMDFPDDRRAEMIEYAKRKYGDERVAAIITFGTMKARAAIKDVARTLAMPLPKVAELTSLIPNIPSKPVTIADCLGFNDDPNAEDEEKKLVPQLRERYDNDPEVRSVLDTALTVEGVARNAGTHAAGVIIGDQPLVEYLPLHRPMGESALAQMTQFGMEICESIGLLKVDFLGLATLTIMRRACELIEKHHGIRYTMDNIPYRPDPNDPELTRKVNKLFDLIGSGETTGVFQLESGGMRKMLKSMKPRTFEHIVAAISLYRPGPMDLIPTYIDRMHGREPVTYKHPLLEDILSETYSIVVYQEQIQQIAAKLFGYTLGEADLMRRAVSKKKKKDLDKHKAIFMEKGPQHGVSAEVAAEIFADIEFFAAYGFNKSHAADYAVLTCQTAFLKAHYPHEYYCALLSVQRHNTADVTLFTADCRRQGIPILPPDVNTSQMDFVIEQLASGQRGIRFGLSAIKTVGDRVVEAILAARNAGGPFTSLTDFARRVDGRAIGKKALESMAKVGAFDSLTNGDRDVAIAVIERLHTFSANYHKRRESGQYDMFGGTQDDGFELPVIPPEKRLRRPELLAIEKELVGLYLSPHPLYAHINELQQEYPNFTYSRDITELAESDQREESDDLAESSGNQRRNEDPVVVAGLVSNVQAMITKRGDEMGKFTLEDVAGTIECVLFPKTWMRCKDVLKPEALVIVFGKADTSRGAPQVLVDNVSTNFTLHQAADEAGSQSKIPLATHTSKRNDQPHPLEAKMPQEMVSGADKQGTESPAETEEYVLPPEEGYFEPEAHTPNLDALPDWLRDEPPPQSQPIQPSNRLTNRGKLSNSNRANGEGNGNRHLPKRLTTETPAYKPSDAPARMITLHMQSQGTEADARRLEIIATKLKSFPGKDRYRVRLTQGKKRYWIEFQETTDYDSVAEFLKQKVGVDNIKVDQLDEME